jgi:hypothetical protein
MVFFLLSDVRFFHVGDKVRVRLEVEFNVNHLALDAASITLSALKLGRRFSLSFLQEPFQLRFGCCGAAPV